MASDVDICNMALLRIGAKTITSLTTLNTEEARRCDACYDHSVKCLEEEHPWDFCMTRVDLTADPTAPNDTYSYRYLLPGDCLLVEKVYEADEDDWEVEQGYLLINDDECTILYRALVTNTTQFPATFIEALIYRLLQTLGPAYNPKADPSGWYQAERIAISRAKRLNAINQSIAMREDQEDRYTKASWDTAGR